MAWTFWPLLTLITAQLVSGFVITSPQVAWQSINPGWNLGNTLDAIPNEDSWGNPLVVPQTFDDIKAAGFKSVRIPVTWTHHFSTEAPNYTVDPTWFARVETVIDYALARNFWVILNVHHDSWEWADLSLYQSGQVDKFEKLWRQIATRFNQKSEKLIFEALNEPAGSPDNEVTSDLYNDLNLRFKNIVRNSGGYNQHRIISLSPLHTNIELGNLWFEDPIGDDKWIYQVHYYSPWNFVTNTWGSTFWGNAADKATMKQDLTTLAGNFSVPILIGEFCTFDTGKKVEKAAAWAWFDYFIRTSKSLGIAVTLWDAGYDFFDRNAHVWRDPTVKDIIMTAVAGKVNTIPENGNATVWIRSGQTVTDQTVYLQYNGNTLKGVYSSSGTALTSSQYSSVSGGIKIKAAYLNTLIAATPALGIIGTIVIKSSQGIDLPIEIRRYSIPTVSTATYLSPNLSSDLYIPVNFKGAKLATVKAVKADGAFLKNDWTVWLGDLQAGRIDWGDFDTDQTSNLIVSTSLLNTIKSSGQAVTLTFEFWPRTDATNKVPVVIQY